MKSLVTFLLFWFSVELPLFSQEFSHTAKVVVDDKEVDFQYKILEVFEKEGLRSSNANLLSFLFQDASPNHVARISKINDSSLQIAVSWQLLRSIAVIEASANQRFESINLEKQIGDALKEFQVILERELKCELPIEVVRFFETSKFEKGLFVRGSQFTGQGRLLTRLREFPFEYSPKLVPAISQWYATDTSDSGNMIVFNVRNSKQVVAQKFHQNRLIWSADLQHDWSGKCRYNDFQYVLWGTGLKQIIFICCSNRFAINVISKVDGSLIWAFCSEWPRRI